MKQHNLDFLVNHPELAESVRLEVTGADLQRFGQTIASSIIEQLKDKIERQEPIEERLLNPDQVAEFLGVTKVTLWNMDKRGDTKPIRLGNSKRYRLSDILELIKQSEYGH